MKRIVRSLSIVLCLCLLLTVFASAEGTLKPYIIKDIDTLIYLPADAVVLTWEDLLEEDLLEDDLLEEDLLEEDLWVEDLMEDPDEDYLISVLGVMGLDDSEYTVELPMIMSDTTGDEDDFFACVVEKISGLDKVLLLDFSNLTEEEIHALDEVYSAIFGLFATENLISEAHMWCNKQMPYLYWSLTYENEGETGWMDMYITFYRGEAYSFVFSTNVEEKHMLSREIMETVVIERHAFYPGGFPDLEGHWAAEDAAKAVELGLFKGNTVAEFCPDDGMTRAMLVQVLYRMEGAPEAGESKFSDVAADAWYADAVAWASENGIVKGSGGKFDPNGLLTREQLAAILWRYAQYEGRDVSVGEDTNILSYQDALSISEYAYTPLQWACGDGLIKGASGNLMPQGTTTRAQVATILVRYLGA